MTDQIPADKVREILEGWERIKEYGEWDDVYDLVKDIRDLLPAPALPTLADMTEEERAACQWMQADTKLWGRVVIIVPDLSDGRTALLDQSGDVIYEDHSSTIPRPDLPRFEWPVAQQAVPAPALPGRWRFAEHPEYGRVIVTTQTPNSAGNVYFVFPDANDEKGHYWHLCDPDRLTYLDQ